MSFRIIITADSRIGDMRLKTIINKASNFREPFKAIAEGYREFQAKQFATGGGEIGGWAPLSPYTIMEKQRLGFPLDILVRTGALQRAMSSKTGDTIEEITKTDMRLGTSLIYAAKHQQGTPRMPARPIIVITEKLAEDWVRILVKYFDET